MAKKKNWFDRLKNFFGSDTKSKHVKKEKRTRWAFSKFKSKCLPVLPAPAVLRSRSLGAAEHEQSKHALAVAAATAVAANAAVAAANAAAEVVRLTGKPLPYHRPREIAAVKIQTTFRGYLARSALKALKGLVKLQALIRGQTVRRQTTNTFRGLQSLMKIQSQARARRVKSLADCQAHDCKNVAHKKTKNSEVTKADMQRRGGRKWDTSNIPQAEMIALLNNRREAATKRERAMEYASSYQERRRPTTPASSKLDANDDDRGWSWLDEWVGSQPLDRDILEIISTSRRDQTGVKAEETPRPKHLGSRRSFNRSRRASVRDEDSISGSPFFPSYMTPTASARARFRSQSMPKQRPRAADSCSEHTDRLLSPLPAMAKALKSPRPKSQAAPEKCRHSSDHLSFDSECSLLSWDQRNTFRRTL